MTRRLSHPIEVVITTPLPPEDAAAHIQRALAERTSLEMEANMASDRRIAGVVEERRVELRVHDARLWTRRKSWNIEFNGTLSPSSAGATLQGSIDIPDRRALRTLMWMFRAVAAMFVVAALAIAARDLAQLGAFTPWAIVGPVVILVGLTGGTILLEAEGERGAGRDAELLVRFLTLRLA